MLDRKKRYLQVALNSSMDDAFDIIQQLPPSDRILIEAGTPLIKFYGIQAIRNLVNWWGSRVSSLGFQPYVVADLKCMDRGESEVQIARGAGASAAVVLGEAPVETITSFIDICDQLGLDSMVDMMNVDQPVKVLRKLKKPPTVVVLHRGVDEEMYNPGKPVPYIQINKVLSSYNVMISIAGGDTIREVQTAVFNGANIVVVWKNFFESTDQTAILVEEFLKEIR